MKGFQWDLYWVVVVVVVGIDLMSIDEGFFFFSVFIYCLIDGIIFRVDDN